MDGASLSSPKLLITGANGFTGKHALSFFQDKGYNCIAVTRQQGEILEARTSKQCNLLRREEVELLIQQTVPNYVLHLAAQNHVGESWNDPVHTMETNILPTLYLLEAIRQVNPACKIIIVGSTLQYNPQNILTLSHPYSLSKTLQTIIAQSWEVLYQMNVVIAKPSNLIGPGESNGICSILAKKIVDIERNIGDKVLEVSNLQARRDFLDVRDAIRGYDTLLQSGKKGEIYEMATGKTLSIEEVMNIFMQHTKAQFSISSKYNLTDDIFKGNPHELMKLGWKPIVPYETSLADILNFYRMKSTI